MYDSIYVLWLLPFHQWKRKELTPHTSRIRTFLSFFAQEIDIQSSLKVNLIIVYYSAQYKSCGNEVPCLLKLTFPIWPVVWNRTKWLGRPFSNSCAFFEKSENVKFRRPVIFCTITVNVDFFFSTKAYETHDSRNVTLKNKVKKLLYTIGHRKN